MAEIFCRLLFISIVLWHKCDIWASSPPAVCTVPPGPVTVPENNTVDIQVVKIISGSDVSLKVTVNPEDLFYIKGNILMVKRGLDYEVIQLNHSWNQHKLWEPQTPVTPEPCQDILMCKWNIMRVSLQVVCLIYQRNIVVFHPNLSL